MAEKQTKAGPAADMDEEKLKQMASQMRQAEYKGLSEEEIQKREAQKEMQRKKNIEILEDTLRILEKGEFEKGGKKICLSYTREQLREAKVFLPGDIEALRRDVQKAVSSGGKTSAQGCSFSCENIDTLTLAKKRYDTLKREGSSDPKVLILNMASGTQPGGRTRQGASAQEEDLCRRTSLLFSLESDDAGKYYDYNNAHKTHMGSDAVVISPKVEVIKDSSGELLAEPFSVSVISCAAPMVRFGLEGMSGQEYEEMYRKRIEGMLLAAASCGYRNLVLGAFGCGIFGNDAALVSDLFARAIQNVLYNGKESGQLFDSIDFAVLCRPEKDYNYREFCRNFSSES